MCDTLASSATNQGDKTVSVAQGGTTIYIYIYIYICTRLTIYGSFGEIINVSQDRNIKKLLGHLEKKNSK